MDGDSTGPGTLTRSGPRVTKLDLGPLDTSVPSFRLHARAVMHEWGLAVIADDAELIVSELVTNASAPRRRSVLSPVQPG